MYEASNCIWGDVLGTRDKTTRVKKKEEKKKNGFCYHAVESIVKVTTLRQIIRQNQ